MLGVRSVVAALIAPIAVAGIVVPLTMPVGSGASTGDVAWPARPNVIVVMTDDMRVSDLAYMPNVRRLIAAQGISFANSFSPNPLCCPARASFLTGQYSHNDGVTSNGGGGVGGFGAFDDSDTFPRALKASGYQTAFVGKYLNEYGVDPSLVTGEPSLTYVPDGWTDWYGAVQLPPNSGYHGGTYNYFDTAFNVNGVVDDSHRGQYQTGVIGTFAQQLADKYSQSSDPFFMWLSFVAPHVGVPRESDDPDPVVRSDGRTTVTKTPARPGWVHGWFDRRIVRAAGLPADGGPAEKDVRDKPSFMRLPEPNRAERRAMRTDTRQRAESVYVVDRAVGALISRLKTLGQWQRTVLLFTSDNGYFQGEHRQRSGKIKAHEPSLRVPLVMAGPGVPAQEVRYDPISTIDLAPTILDLAGARRYVRHTMDGVSKLPMILGGDRGWSAPVVTEGRVAGALLKNATASGFHHYLTSIGLRTARYSYIHYIDGESELYDLRTDPNELTNVAGNAGYADVRRRFRRLWWQYKECVGTANCHQALPLSLRASPARERDLTQHFWSAVHARYGTYRGDSVP